MLIDARTLSTETRLEVDLCILGGGPAGLTIADSLAGSSLSIAVLESGGTRPEPEDEALLAGTVHGPLYGRKGGYLATTRTRAFGGLADFWRGSSRPFDGEDLAARAWVAGSGWPLTLADLEPYHRRAFELLELPPDAGPPARELLVDDDRFTSSWLAYAPPTALGDPWRRRLAAAANVRILLRANAVALDLDDAGRQVERARVVCPGGPRFEVRARRFVLAAGAIESARLLLASNSQRPAGLGNGHDLVGRYFMDQLIFDVGIVALPGQGSRPLAYRALKSRPGRRGIMRPTTALQARHELLNSLATLIPTTTRRGGALAAAIGHSILDQARLREPSDTPSAQYFGVVTLRGEQLPERDNRVALGATRDAAGLPRVALSARPGDHDAWSLKTTAQLLAESLGRRGLGRLRYDEPFGLNPRRFKWSGYQSGTTRMSREASQGVVDTDCRVHEVPNLFVAGSSVFPTSGCSGPMVTLVALALRLSDHLRGLFDA
jgi:choline dehydrogenase-like flavoprotein